ncbi:importin beta-like SAD2 [Physcomitrium patens]|uniref:Importin N-terminal domain-containing protein n=1 Tax=Physcomitrium patens TaxID=3218 RepID=A0A2K1JE00_PHYPA|nr:importin beta-like SAD2 [Physcomitrium patens]PNR39761.1 hypothetical protein PHYPA_020041 [Physcomitrium patens]|eukprot:XP_024396720.1 importin beta-like SAD2 [Physcomitrella patens]
MDLQTLATVLQSALSTNPEERKAGEERLNQYQHVQGHLAGLLQIIVAAHVDLSIRQCASIYFKNVIARDWVPREPVAVPKISDTDKALVRENILEAIVQAPYIIRVQLGECLKTCIHADYPEQWPDLLPAIFNNLKSQDQQRVYGALYALRILTRKYEFKDEEERAPVYHIINSTFPVLLEILNHLLALPNPTIEVADLIKLILKIFWSSAYLEIPKLLHDVNTFTGWMSSFHNLLERPVPVEGQPTDPEQRKVWGWWKVKKWTLHIMNRLYNRFGDPKMSKPENKAFAQMFQKSFSGKFLELYMKLLSVVRENGYLPDRVINLALQYLSTSVSKAITYQLLRPQLDVVLFEIIFPLMCFNDADDQLWREDPHEYVRKGYDIIEDMYSPRTAAINFISELVRKRGKENWQKFLAFIVEVFRRYDEAPQDQKPYRQKDGALLAVGALNDKLKHTEPYKSQLETMLVNHVYPEFRSPAGHLRAKAAWVAGQYADITFSDQRHFTAALHSVVAALTDPELPVRVDSVVSLRTFVEACKDLSEIRPILPQLLDEFFKLMNEVENEDLVFTLETIVDKFGEEMAPYALGLCQNLAAAFWKCLEASENDGDEDDSGALAAVGCLRAIGTILESISRLPELYPAIEPTLLPIMQRMLTIDGQDIFEEVLEIVSYMTYFSPVISPNMWSLWPLMVDSVQEWAIDYFGNILVPLDNYVSRSTEHFLTSTQPDYQSSLFKVLSTLMVDEKFEDADIEPAPKLIEAVLQNCRGRVDQWLEPYLRISIERLRKTRKNYLKDLLVNVVANGLYYNASMTLTILQHLGVTSEFFQTWFRMLYEVKKSGKPLHFVREHDKKVCILGLASLLAVPTAAMPPELQAGLDQVFKALLKLLVAYKEQRAEAAKLEEAEEDEEEEWDGTADDGVWDKEIDDDEEDDGDGESTEKLQKLAAQAKAFSHADDSDSDFEDFADDEEFQAPIDNIDAFVFFSDVMKAISVSDPARFQALSSSLDFQHQAWAHGLAQHAEERRKEIEKEAMEKAAAGSGGITLQ